MNRHNFSSLCKISLTFILFCVGAHSCKMSVQSIYLLCRTLAIWVTKTISRFMIVNRPSLLCMYPGMNTTTCHKYSSLCVFTASCLSFQDIHICSSCPAPTQWYWGICPAYWSCGRTWCFSPRPWSGGPVVVLRWMFI